MTRTLPMPAVALIPHQPPMVYIDHLLEADEQRGLCDARLASGHMLLEHDGRMLRCGFIELAAQTFAAVKGWEFVRQGLPFPAGYLVGVHSFSCLGDAHREDHLYIETACLGTFEGFGVVNAVITRGTSVLAQGKIKLYVPPVPSRTEG